MEIVATSGFYESKIPKIDYQRIVSSGLNLVASSYFESSSYDSCIEIQKVPLSDTLILHRHSPLVLEIKAIEDDGCMAVYVPDFDNIVAGYKLEEIEETCLELIAFLWEEYVWSDDDDILAEDAKKLKTLLIEKYVEEASQCKEGMLRKDYNARVLEFLNESVVLMSNSSITT